MPAVVQGEEKGLGIGVDCITAVRLRHDDAAGRFRWRMFNGTALETRLDDIIRFCKTLSPHRPDAPGGDPFHSHR